jgi:hypothetical protein
MDIIETLLQISTSLNLTDITQELLRNKERRDQLNPEVVFPLERRLTGVFTMSLRKASPSLTLRNY